MTGGGRKGSECRGRSFVQERAHCLGLAEYGFHSDELLRTVSIAKSRAARPFEVAVYFSNSILIMMLVVNIM